jgi:hypothetical protein
MKRALISSLLATAVAGVAFAGTQDDAVVALHVKAHQTAANKICPGQVNAKTKVRESEDPNSKGLHCGMYEETSVLAKTDVYLVVANADPSVGIAGLSCGIDYGINLRGDGWQLCADLQFPNGSWPAAGGGNRITWAAGTRCQDGSSPSDDIATTAGVGHGRDFGPGMYKVHAIAGALYMYSYVGYPDVLQVTMNNGLVIPEFRVADCSASESEVTMGGGAVGYQGEPGFNPCDFIVPTEETTWGALKSKQRSE